MAGHSRSSTLVTASLARIEEYDGGEIELNAVITLNPDAEQIAAELDAELAAGNARGPLHGIPVLLKDIIATGDQMPNTAGSTGDGRKTSLSRIRSWPPACARPAR